MWECWIQWGRVCLQPSKIGSVFETIDVEYVGWAYVKVIITSNDVY